MAVFNYSSLLTLPPWGVKGNCTYWVISYLIIVAQEKKTYTITCSSGCHPIHKFYQKINKS